MRLRPDRDGAGVAHLVEDIEAIAHVGSQVEPLGVRLLLTDLEQDHDEQDRESKELFHVSIDKKEDGRLRRAVGVRRLYAAKK